MSYPTPLPSSEVYVTAQLADLSTMSSAYVAAPIRGRIVRAYSCLANAITTADAAWTIKVNGTAAADAVTIAQSGSAAGTVDEAVMPDLGSANYVNEGDTIEFASDGGSSTTCVTQFTAAIRPGG